MIHNDNTVKKERTPIEDNLINLEQTIDILDKQLNELYKRLHPLLKGEIKQIDDNMKNGISKSFESEFSKTLASFNTKLDQMVHETINIHDRLEL